MAVPDNAHALSAGNRCPPLTSTQLIDRLVPIRCLVVAVGSAAEALGDRRMTAAICEVADRIEKDLDRLIDNIQEAVQ